MHYRFYVKTSNRFTHAFMDYSFSVGLNTRLMLLLQESLVQEWDWKFCYYWIFENGIISTLKMSFLSLWNLGINCFIWFSDIYSMYFNGCRLVMLRVDARQGAPRDGNSLLEMFQVSDLVLSKCLRNRYMYYLVTKKLLYCAFLLWRTVVWEPKFFIMLADKEMFGLMASPI